MDILVIFLAFFISMEVKDVEVGFDTYKRENIQDFGTYMGSGYY